MRGSSALIQRVAITKRCNILNNDRLNASLFEFGEQIISNQFIPQRIKYKCFHGSILANNGRTGSKSNNQLLSRQTIRSMS